MSVPTDENKNNKIQNVSVTKVEFELEALCPSGSQRKVS
jgi:hypothetical protein